MTHRIGVDIGGTFTDAVGIDAQGRIRTAKALTTPGRLHEGVLAAIEALGVGWDDIETVIHGTTAGLNAFLERRGAAVALLTTRGFRDVYELGRASRPDMYDVRYRHPTPLVARRSVFEVDERMGPDGAVIQPVQDARVSQLCEQLGAYDAVAVCLLHAYANPVHERRVAALITEQLPDVTVVCSHEIAPEWREYERTSTTVMSAYVAPIVEAYLAQLEQELSQKGLKSTLRVMQSNGGIMTAAVAQSKPIQTLFSGPVGGTIAGVALSRDLSGMEGADRLICVDMGGTSFDVSLVIDGTADVETSATIEGHPLLAPMVAIHTIGAGGGSVAHVAGGGLRVGPRSAGATPGPASYGNGGTEPTVTDANLLLGRFPRSARLGGGLALDVAAADRAMAAVAGQIGMPTADLAAGVVAVADAAMANAIREITIKRGIDPREFSLVAFGGAGPLHAVALAEELELPRVIVPADPGVLSAYGMLQSDARHDAVRSFYARIVDIDPADMSATLDELTEQARLLLKEDGVESSAISFEASADLRYSGQEYTVTVPFSTSGDMGEVLEALPDAFSRAHQLRYGHSNPEEMTEVVNLRIAALGRIARPGRAEVPTGDVPDPIATDPAWFAGRWVDTPVFNRAQVPPDRPLAGPAIVLEDACTVLVPPEWTATASGHGHLIIERTS